MVFNLIEKLSAAYGPSGRETEVSSVIADEIRDYVDEIYTDKLGNLIAHKKGTGKKVMVSAHMDSIGLAVTYIEEEGFLRFGAVGGISKADIVNTLVKFKDGTVGVVSFDEDKKLAEITLSDFYIDIGAKSREEAKKMVQVGDFAVFCASAYQQNDIIIAPYMDNRIGCVAEILAIKENVKSDKDIYYVFSSQEEVGLRGAITASYTINPDYAIAIDVTDTGDTPKKEHKIDVGLGKGPCVKIMDSSVICDEYIKDTLYKAAKELKFFVQDEVLRFGGTDTAAMQKARGGAQAGAISIPTRYIHSPCEMINVNDVLQSAKLLSHAIKLL